MSHLWIDPNACPSLAVLVESVTAPLLMEHEAPVCLEMDIDLDIPVPGDGMTTADLIRSLALQALCEMPDGGDLTVTGCQTENGLELELADSGADLQSRAKRIPMAAAAIGAQIEWQNCPQGGVAATVIFPKKSVGQRKAA